jgi:hypothetical protein
VADIGWRLIAGMESSSISTFAGNRGRALAKAEAAWREAAYVVSLRWDAFLRSEALTRSFAFGSYLAALDAEEAAAAEVSRLVAGTAGSAAAA